MLIKYCRVGVSNHDGENKVGYFISLVTDQLVTHRGASELAYHEFPSRHITWHKISVLLFCCCLF